MGQEEREMHYQVDRDRCGLAENRLCSDCADGYKEVLLLRKTGWSYSRVRPFHHR